MSDPKYTDPQTGEVIHCECCAMYPATREVHGEEQGGWAAFCCDDVRCEQSLRDDYR